MDQDEPPRKRAWTYVLVLGGIVAVTFSWLTPEPKTEEHEPPAGVEEGVYVQCGKQNVAPPEYGNREVGYQCVR